jgi:hypothetical protein
MKERKVIAYSCGYKYQGILISETDTIYLIDDIKDGKVTLPKQNTILKDNPNG